MEVELTGLDAVDVGAAVVVPTPEELEGEVTAPFPMLVVIGPLSMYTPEKYQSSVVEPLVRRRNPRCQSSLLVDVDAGMFWTTFTSGEEPVDAQRPTVLALN